MQKILRIVLIIVLLVGVYFVLNGKKDNNVVSPITVPTIEKQTMKDSADNYDIDIDYPDIKGVADPKTETDLNNILLNSVVEASDSFKGDVARDAIKLEGAKSQYISKYEVVFLNEQFLSIKFTDFYYVTGMAHPQTIYRGFNYDILNGKELALADFFNRGVDFLSEVASLAKGGVKSQLEAEQYYFADMVDAGTAPKADNYSEFVFDKEGFTIIFSPYMVAPYVAGPVFVKIPYAKLSDISKDSEVMKRVIE